MSQKELLSGVVTDAQLASVEALMRCVLTSSNIAVCKIETGVRPMASHSAEVAEMPYVRIIACFEDNVEEISNALYQEFELQVTSEISVVPDPADFFSAKGISYYAKPRHGSADLGEVRVIKVELSYMLREVLTVFENELGYQRPDFPEDAKRDLCKISALLEMAGQEMMKLSRKMQQIPEKSVTSLVYETDLRTLTEATLLEYVQNSPVIREIDATIATRTNATLSAHADIDGDIDRLHFLKITTIAQLHEKLVNYKKEVVAFAVRWIGNDNGGTFDPGISLFYLEYFLVGQANDQQMATDYVLRFVSDSDYSARYIIPTYKSVTSPGYPELSRYSA